MSDKKYEVSSISNDSYQFYLDLASKTRDEIAKVSNSIDSTKQGIISQKQELESLEKSVRGLEQSLQILKQKELDVKNIIIELEKNKNHFKSIVTNV